MFIEDNIWENGYTPIFPNWDRIPRGGKSTIACTESTLSAFYNFIENLLSTMKKKSDGIKILFIQSSSEWGGNYYEEPDLKYVQAYLDTLRGALK